MDAAVEGLVDYAEARLLDPAWWRRFRVLIRGLERRKRSQATLARLQHYLAQVANGNLTRESFDKAQENANEAYYDYVGAIRPWEGRSYEDRRRRELKDGRQQYIDAFGADPADPRFKAWEAEQIRRLEAGEFDTATESDEEAVTRRLQDRIRKG